MRTTDRYAALNRRARHDYLIEDKLEAGLVLHGTEVKSLRQGGASIAEAYADVQSGELFLVNANIPEYKASARFNHQPRRPRKLLLHRKQVDRLLGAVRREGVTIVPLALYFNERGRAKVELGLATGKRKSDKRQAERDRDWQRNKARLLRSRDL
ncbi:MAG: SsrA-binding protein SmpB [Alphaproteobacteria bacterium]|jgi:SsrA-binding protein|nr:MAG: SsrA-binding protein SmpB [Alphaproteobacteria bacterium]TMK06211.1 MAG: SsrA-binding protein SmpB [Alphaproteobacteria bacterium]TMK36919.1 MAG: SsrA-binding protein SmpB [Alphaproteobacteria bacterium]